MNLSHRITLFLQNQHSNTKHTFQWNRTPRVNYNPLLTQRRYFYRHSCGGLTCFRLPVISVGQDVTVEDPLSSDPKINVLITSPICHIHLLKYTIETICWKVIFCLDKNSWKYWQSSLLVLSSFSGHIKIQIPAAAIEPLEWWPLQRVFTDVFNFRYGS